MAAITAANGVGPSTIDLAPNCTYTLTAVNNSPLGQGANGLPVVRKTVVLVGSSTTIERSSIAPNFRILEVAGASGNSASLTLQGITVSGGHTSGLIGNAGRGGCLLATYTGLLPTSSTLTLQNSEVEDCTAVAGGGIYAGSRATLAMTSSSVKSNTAGSGGGIDLDSSASATIGHSFVNDNSAASGGGLRNNGDATLTSDTVAGNSALIAGGGIYNAGDLFFGASFALQNSSTVGGGIFAGGSADTHIAGSKLQFNIALIRGGGLDNTGDAFLQNSFILMNTAPFGGGVFESLSGFIAVVNSLIAGNTVFNCSPPASVPSCVN
ncbi:MAG TPA: hypothetical protein VMU94_14925 [Streptosporangiaceae bacterium]|nr:hypothetical protein [Streptosporangiaceae bacterium]